MGLLVSGASAQDPVPLDKPADKSSPNKDSAATPQAKPADDAPDPLKRPLDAKKKKQQMKDYSKEIKGTYKKRLEEDEVYIISDQEKHALKQLPNDAERANFI